MSKKRKHHVNTKRPRKTSGPPAAKKQRIQSGGSAFPAMTLTRPYSASSVLPSRQKQTHPQHLQPIIPFLPDDSILLVGEGDLSFAASLVEHHYCERVTATVVEKNLDELLEKYPHAGKHVAKVQAEDGCRVLFGVDARRMGPFTAETRKEKVKEKDGGKNADPPAGLMDRILFNFPHIGGQSTDINRQVRRNQELLVDFFSRALLSLAPGGSIVVTLFEGEPYTLWNVKDLARHAGLQVERSFWFQASAYPGYQHARTLGVIRNKQGVIGCGWKGEERAARSYVFMRKGDVPKVARGNRRRPEKEDSSSSEE